MVAAPVEARNWPLKILSKVDFPAPLGPSNPVTPGPISSEISLTPITCPYHSETRRVLMITGSPPTRATGCAWGAAGCFVGVAAIFTARDALMRSPLIYRSEERRVGKEGRSWWLPAHLNEHGMMSDELV